MSPALAGELSEGQVGGASGQNKAIQLKRPPRWFLIF